MLKNLPDKQRTKCYAWEKPLWKYEYDKSEQELNKLFCKLRMVFGINNAQMHFNDVYDLCIDSSYQLYYEICLHEDHHCYHVLCHEFAHLVIYHWFEQNSKKQIEPHGEEWLTVYMILLHRVCGHSIEKLIESAHRKNLRFFESIVRKYGNNPTAEAVQNGQQGQEYTCVVG